MIIKKIVAATDFSEAGERSLEFAATFANKFKAEIHLLNVVEPMPPGPWMGVVTASEIKKKTFDECVAKIEKLKSAWSAYSFSVNGIVIEGEPFVKITKYADSIQADLVVLGTHGHGAVSNMLLGSVAENTVRYSNCPVLTVRAHGHQFTHPLSQGNDD